MFFVKTWEGDAQRERPRGFAAAPPETPHGRKIAVRFKDGELLCGYSLAYTPDREGFFIFPADADSNKMRVYVVTSSTAEVKVGPAAETLALRMLGSDGARGETAAGASSMPITQPAHLQQQPRHQPPPAPRPFHRGPDMRLVARREGSAQ